MFITHFLSKQCCLRESLTTWFSELLFAGSAANSIVALLLSWGTGGFKWALLCPFTLEMWWFRWERQRSLCYYFLMPYMKPWPEVCIAPRPSYTVGDSAFFVLFANDFFYSITKTVIVISFGCFIMFGFEYIMMKTGNTNLISWKNNFLLMVLFGSHCCSLYCTSLWSL